MWQIKYTRLAAKDVPKLKAAHLNEKAKRIIDIIREDPFANHPPYEKLLGDFQGAYSRRINIQHRLVYRVVYEPVVVDGVCFQGTVIILSLWSHYER